MDEDYIYGLIGIVVVFAVLAGIFFGFWYGIQSIICNASIATQDGWTYLGEGQVATLDSSTITVDCYGITHVEKYQNKIGDIPIYNNSVYTPVPQTGGFHKVGLSLFSFPPSFDQLKEGQTYRVYERDFGWDKQYLVICK